jgi:hypothetical protein
LSFVILWFEYGVVCDGPRLHRRRTSELRLDSASPAAATRGRKKEKLGLVYRLGFSSIPRFTTVSSSHSCLHGLARWPTHTAHTHTRPTHTYTASGPTPTDAGCDIPLSLRRHPSSVSYRRVFRAPTYAAETPVVL